MIGPLDMKPSFLVVEKISQIFLAICRSLIIAFSPFFCEKQIKYRIEQIVCYPLIKLTEPYIIQPNAVMHSIQEVCKSTFIHSSFYA